MKLFSRTNLILAACAALASGLYGQTSTTADDDVRNVTHAIRAVGGAVADLSRAAQREEYRDGEQTAVAAQRVRTRSATQSVAIVTAGATAGASIAAASKNGPQAVVAGAIIGGIAGLIYDHMTAYHNVEAPAGQGEPAPPPPVER